MTTATSQRMTLRDAANQLGVAVKTIRNWRDRGLLCRDGSGRVVRLATGYLGGRVVVTADELGRFLAAVSGGAAGRTNPAAVVEELRAWGINV